MRSANGYFHLSKYGRHKGLWIAVTFAALLLSACGGNESASGAGENSGGIATGNTVGIRPAVRSLVPNAEQHKLTARFISIAWHAPITSLPTLRS